MGRIAQVRPRSPPKSKKIVDQVHEILLTLSRIEGAFEALFRFGEAKMVEVTATPEDGEPVSFEATVRLDTPNEVRYFRNGGILQTVLRQLK